MPNLRDLASSTYDALLLDDSLLDANLKLRLIHTDGRSGSMHMGDLLRTQFELHLDGDAKCLRFASANEVVAAGWRKTLPPPVVPIEDPEVEIVPDPHLSNCAHLGSEIPCLITLRLVNQDPADALLFVELLIAPMLTSGFGFRFAPEVERLANSYADPAFCQRVTRWVRSNRGILCDICRGGYDLARDLLDINIADGNLAKVLAGLSTSDPVESMIADAAARNSIGRHKTMADFSYVGWHQELQRLRIISAHRKRYALGILKGLPTIIY